MIYLDHAATTPVLPEVFAAMQPYFAEEYANPSGIYAFARETARAVEAARREIAETLGVSPEEICFTSGGTEADNWAVVSAARSRRGRVHILTTAIEHHAILNCCASLPPGKAEVTLLRPEEDGIVRPEKVERAIREETVLLSVMYANNEVGTLQPIEEIGAIAHRRGILFHTDAVQAYGHLPIHPEKCYIDLLSASGHKLGAPKGVGFLYLGPKAAKLRPLLYGGGQEGGRRAGTENVASIVGLGAAARLAHTGMEEREARIRRLREHLTRRLLAEIPYCRLNGDRNRRLPGNANFCFQFVEGGNLLMLLDEAGVCASAASACSAGSGKPSHVLTAMGVPPALARGSLRLTLGEENTREEIDYAADVIREGVRRLRRNSGIYEDFACKISRDIV